jgi:hypothetical protein
VSVFFAGALAIDASNDQLVVANGGNIVLYKSATEGNGEIESFKPKGIGVWTEAVAVDGQRQRIYVSFCKNETLDCGVMVVGMGPGHPVLGEVDGATTPAGGFAAPAGRTGLAVDEATGDFFVGDILSAKTIYQFGEDFEYLSRWKSNEFQATASVQMAVSNGERSVVAEPCGYPDPENVVVPAGDACNRHVLFGPVLNFDGRAIAFHRPDQTPSVIKSVSTGGIGENEAELTAKIFPGGLDTEYAFEIITQAAFEVEGFNGATMVGEGAISSDSLAAKVSANATRLTPGESYRFRVVAENELGPAAEEGQNEATFSTYDDALVPGGCSNEPFRIGPSARLADCRAYELVTPADTQGRPPKGVSFGFSMFPTIESSPDGTALWFRIEGGSLPESSGVGSFDGDPYVARRGATGWSSTLEGPSGDEATVSIPNSTSPDQGYLFWTARFEGSLVIDGRNTEYVRYPDGHSELIGRGSLGEDPVANGRMITEDGSHILFETIELQLEPNAPSAGTRAVYDRTPDEVTHVVSLLPGDVTPAAGQSASYVGASPNGEAIAFSIGNSLYLRVGNETTYEIGTGVEFAGVSEGGERIFYVESDDLLAFDTSSKEAIEFSTTGDVTPVNVANEGSRAYFVSESVQGGANPQGDTAQAGAQNLYLSEEGAISFIATVTDRDVEGAILPPETIPSDGLGLWTDVLATQPAKDPSRLNPDGSVLLFQSEANLTGYDSGNSPQVFRYDSSTDRLHCISCIPTKAPATGGARLQTVALNVFGPEPLSPSAFVPNLTPDGKRVFFESTEALVSSDTDEVNDVYEWEEAGVGSCKLAGGCVYLISSGQSERANYLYAHSTSGDDVFFSSEDSLVGGDALGASIYDAKVGGGFEEMSKNDPCEDEACHPPATPPTNTPTPPSAVAGRDGNIPKTCPKGKRKVKKNGKVRCVKKQKKQGQKGKDGTSRGAGK